MTRRRISQSEATESGLGSPGAWRILALPLAGASLLAAVIANEIGTGAIMNPTLHVLAARTIALMLLLRIVAKERVGLMKATANWPMVATSVGAFIYACVDYPPPGVGASTNTARALLLATVGSAAGVLAYFRALGVLRWCATHLMPVCIAVAISLTPTIFYSFHTILWQWTAGTTVAIVKALIWLCGIALKSESRSQPVPEFRLDNVQGDFISSIQSARISVFFLAMQWSRRRVDFSVSSSLHSSSTIGTCSGE